MNILSNKYIIELGSSTIKFYEVTQCMPRPISEKTIDFRNHIDKMGLSQVISKTLYDYISVLIKEYSLNKLNTKVFATGIFRDIADSNFFVESFYTQTTLKVNIISQDTEIFYLERAWIGKYQTPQYAY